MFTEGNFFVVFKSQKETSKLVVWSWDTRWVYFNIHIFHSCIHIFTTAFGLTIIVGYKLWSSDSVDNSPSTPCNFSSENISRKTFERKHEILCLHFHLCTMCFVIDQSIVSGIHIFTFNNSSRNIPLNISFFIHFLCTFGVRFLRCKVKDTAGFYIRRLKCHRFLAMTKHKNTGITLCLWFLAFMCFCMLS